jgi:hypothetical protein
MKKAFVLRVNRYKNTVPKFPMIRAFLQTRRAEFMGIFLLEDFAEIHLDPVILSIGKVQRT